MKCTLLALTLLAALPFAASAAEGVSYNYVEGGYLRTDIENSGTNNDADGWALNGSGAIAPNFHVFGGYSRQGVKNTDIDLDNWRLGLGYNKEIAPKIDLLTRVAYERYETRAPGFSKFKQDGYSVEAGVRGAFTPNIEGYALAGYEDTQDFDGDFYGKVGALVKFNQTVGVTGEVKFADGDARWFVGPRISF